MTWRTRITTSFTRASTARDALAGVDLSGHRAIVTGGASGPGLETARALASTGAEYLASQPSELADTDGSGAHLARLRTE